MLGPQQDLFTNQGIETLFSNPYEISNDADRMGYRLEGEKIEHKEKPDIISDALCLGAIQVPGHGMPIVMMADRQTTGGYGKIGTVIGPDLTWLAQAKPGDAVRFIRCSDEEAVRILEEEQGIYKKIETWIVVPPQLTNGRKFEMTINGQGYNVEVEEVLL